MHHQLEQRLKELKAEFDAGQRMLADLEAKRTNLRDSMLRISGAIQVLHEELSQCDHGNGELLQKQELKTEEA